MILASGGEGSQWTRRQYVPGGPQLGMIPSWQLVSDPGVNIKLNPNVYFPDGWNQRTVQPQGSFYQPPPREAQPNLGSVFDSWAWQNRQWIVLGGVGLTAAALLALAGSFLK